MLDYSKTIQGMLFWGYWLSPKLQGSWLNMTKKQNFLPKKSNLWKGSGYNIYSHSYQNLARKSTDLIRFCIVAEEWTLVALWYLLHDGLRPHAIPSSFWPISIMVSCLLGLLWFRTVCYSLRKDLRFFIMNRLIILLYFSLCWQI